jgi:hypothetical protein
MAPRLSGADLVFALASPACRVGNSLLSSCACWIIPHPMATTWQLRIVREDLSLGIVRIHGETAEGIKLLTYEARRA